MDKFYCKSKDKIIDNVTYSYCDDCSVSSCSVSSCATNDYIFSVAESSDDYEDIHKELVQRKLREEKLKRICNV